MKLVAPALLINGQIRACGGLRGHYSELRHYVAEKFLRPSQWEECGKLGSGSL